jgi:hypothetical protein
MFSVGCGKSWNTDLNVCKDMIGSYIDSLTGYIKIVVLQVMTPYRVLEHHTASLFVVRVTLKLGELCSSERHSVITYKATI